MCDSSIDKGRIIRTLEWMINTLKHQFDEETGHGPGMGANQYSPEMTEAIALLEELKGA